MTSEAPELLPCPFCGKPARVFGSNMVGCEDQSNCGANVDWGHYTKGDGPKQAWNRRADLSPQWRQVAFAIKGIVEDCCLTDERGKIVAFDHKDFEMRFHTLLAKVAPNEP